ncbi:IS66 family transposase [Sphaerotilus sp.]|uniref:IS66 family transposase n=1 Tax=Sphaerotilus sp. TaxID=2093942 RepID=UPI002ACE37A7|nr:IS66 family transposase [Sphaerotilus sp.]MDZ7855794.1 IS66 family transposase [Sphaerotilus sp.]
MLDAPPAPALDTAADGVPASDSLQALRDQIERMQAELKFSQTRIEALNFEVARLKRWRFGTSAESLDASTQAVLFDAILADTAQEDDAAKTEGSTPAAAPRTKRQAVRQALPAGLPRVERHHDIGATHCACGQALQRIGEEVSEQLDCVPAQFFVLRHIRGKYACACCQTIQAAPMPAQMIDKGIPAAGLLAQVAIAKVDDHLPLYRQTEIYARSGVHIPRSSMAQWLGICGVRLQPLAAALADFILGHAVLHADETPVALLAPGRGKTKKAYVWVYHTTNFVGAQGRGRAMLYDFTASRAGEHPQRVLAGFNGTLVSDDFSGYHALHRRGITPAFCMAHARRKLFEAFELNGSQIAGQAVALIAKLYEIEREVQGASNDDRLLARQQRSKPVADALHAWLTGQRQLLVKADATARAIDYALSNWPALTTFLGDGAVPIDNNAAENAIRPLAVGRKNWLFVGSQMAGERAAVLMSLIESAKLNGHDPWAYLKDVFERLPTLKNRDLAQLLPHNWQPAKAIADPCPGAVCAAT